MLFGLIQYTESRDWFAGKVQEHLGPNMTQYEVDHLWFTATHTLNHLIIFYGLNILLAICYKFNLFAKYRVRPESEFPSMKLVWTSLIESLFSTTIGAPLLVYYILWPLVCTKLVRAADGTSERVVAVDFSTTMAEQPIHLTIMQLVVSFFAEDAMFYWMHRLLHHSAIYKHIHKKHHQFKYTVGLAAEYAHPVEIVLGNVIPTHAGALIFGMPHSVLLFWTSLRVWEAVDGHSGYAFPLSPWNMLLALQGGAERHDFHHSHNVGSYGSFTKLWDWIAGTDKAYKEWQKKSHKEFPLDDTKEKTPKAVKPIKAE